MGAACIDLARSSGGQHLFNRCRLCDETPAGVGHEAPPQNSRPPVGPSSCTTRLTAHTYTPVGDGRASLYGLPGGLLCSPCSCFSRGATHGSG